MHRHDDHPDAIADQVRQAIVRHLGELHSAPLAYQIDDAVRVSGTTRTRIYEGMRDGTLPYRKIGRSTIIMRADLEMWLDKISVRHNGPTEAA